MHRLLERQLKKIGYSGGSLSEKQLRRFIEAVDRAYRDDEADRKLLEHTLEISSKEMQQLYRELEERSRSRLAESEAKYRFLAIHDNLTGIANRRYLEDELQALIKNSKIYSTKFALIFLDLDYFKKINDTLGHNIGDKLLKEVANRISPHLKSNDIFARIGGDEFVIVLLDIKESNLINIIDRIYKLIRKTWVVDKYRLDVTASMGVAVYPNDGKDMIELMKNADIAMYMSKERGRDRYTFFQDRIRDED